MQQPMQAVSRAVTKLVLLCHKIAGESREKGRSVEPARNADSDAPAQRGDGVSHVALRALGSRVGRSPGIRQVSCGLRRFFTAPLNEALCHKKSINGNAQRCMVMESASSSPLEVPKAELLLEILVVAFNAPAHFGNVNQTFHRCVFWQC